MNTKASLALLLLFCILLPASAQNNPAPQPQQTPDDKDDVVKINTNLVQVDVVVTKNGKPVPNLTAEDFEIFEDGRRQAITNFAYISNVAAPAPQPVKTDNKKTAANEVPYAPININEPHRTIAFVVDDLGLSAESMNQVRKQLRKFVAEQLQPNDLVAIMRTGGELGALQQFTNDKRLLNRAVDHLRWNICSRAGIHVIRPVQLGGGDGSPLCGFRSIFTTFKSLRFIVDAMGHLPGRKSLVLMSDSVPIESQDDVPDRGVLKDADIVKDDPLRMGPDSINHSISLQKIAEKAIRSSVVIYSVDTQGLQYTGLTAADAFTGSPQQMQNLLSLRSRLLFDRRQGGELIARQTGGFQIRNSNNYELHRILEDQSGYYLLGYRPTNETFNRRFHHIKAKVKRSGMTLRTRYGFFGVTEEEANQAKATTRNSTNLALASPFGAQDIEVDLTSFFADDNGPSPLIRSAVYIDPTNLSFTRVEGGRQASFEVHSAVFGDNGVIVEQVTRSASVKLFDEDSQSAMRRSVVMGFDMRVKRPGAYQMRLAVRDKTSGKLGSAGQFVVVPDLKNKRLAVSGILLGTGGTGQTIVNAGARRFVSNTDLYYAFNLFNATNESGKLRNLVMSVMLFREGKIVYTGPEAPIVATAQSDLNRMPVGGGLRLGPQLESGHYYLQVVITDKDAKEKTATVTQWADFEIQKP